MQQSMWCHSKGMCQRLGGGSTVMRPGDADWSLLCSAVYLPGGASEAMRASIQ